MSQKIKDKKSSTSLRSKHPRKTGVAPRAIIYCRVSSERQANEGHGLDSQEHRCREYAKSKGYEVEEVFRDSFTGGGDFIKRPAMSALLLYTDNHPYNNYVVIFDDLSRFARDVAAHLRLRQEFDHRGIKIECPNFTFNDTPEGELIETIMAAQNQYHRKSNKRQVVQRMKARLEAGYWTFGSKKGYTMVKDPLHGKLAIPYKIEAQLLKHVLEGFSVGLFVRKIDACEYLVKNGFWGDKAQRPEKYIEKFSWMLKDIFYAGFIEYPEWGVERRKGHHEAIISLETYKANQRRLKSEGLSKRIRVDISEDFPLRGLHVCGDCGKSLTGAWSRGRSKKYPYYFCQNSSCDQKGKAIPKEEMEKAFTALLKKHTLKYDASALVKEIFDEVWKDEIEQAQKSEAVKQEHRQSLNDKVKELTGLIIRAKSEAVRVIYEKQLEEIALELETIGFVAVRDLDMSVPYQTALCKAGCLLKSPYKLWNSVDVLEKHRLYFFIFEEKLAYSKKEGYRTDNLPSAVRLFEEFACTNSHDVEMGGIEPPCRRCSF